MFKTKSTWSSIAYKLQRKLKSFYHLLSSMIHDASSPYEHFKCHMSFKRGIFGVGEENQQRPFLPKPDVGNKSQRLRLRKDQLEHVDKKNPKESKSNINYTFPRKDMIHTYYTVMFVSMYSTVFRHVRILNIHNKSSIDFVWFVENKYNIRPRALQLPLLIFSHFPLFPFFFFIGSKYII